MVIAIEVHVVHVMLYQADPSPAHLIKTRHGYGFRIESVPLIADANSAAVPFFKEFYMYALIRLASVSVDHRVDQGFLDTEPHTEVVLVGAPPPFVQAMQGLGEGFPHGRRRAGELFCEEPMLH